MGSIINFLVEVIQANCLVVLYFNSHVVSVYVLRKYDQIYCVV